MSMPERTPGAAPVSSAPWLLLMDMHGDTAVLLSPEKGKALEPWQAEAAQQMRERAAQLAGKLPTTAAWISPDGERVTPFRPEVGAWVARKMADFLAIGVPPTPN
jgi:hypothetical protein